MGDSWEALFVRMSQSQVKIKKCHGNTKFPDIILFLKRIFFFLLTHTDIYIDEKSCLRETLTLSKYADNSIVSKTNQNMLFLFGTPPRFQSDILVVS